MLFIIMMIITLAYLFLIAVFIYGFEKVPLFYLEDIPAKTAFSIVIPFRNEAHNLPQLLKSIKDLEYPKNLFEIILVDDASEDQSIEVIKTFIDNGFNNIRILKNRNLTDSPKKDAITTAIQLAKHEWIVTTDADCKVPKLWLKSFDCYIQKHHCRFVAAPVNYYEIASFLDRFQTLDFLSLMGTTIGAFGIGEPFLANGANLAYQKSLFTDLSGFKGSTEIASGDDIFLLQKALKNNPKDVGYIKSIQATVDTRPERNWKQLVFQRLRWTAKATHYKSFVGILTGIIVLLMNLLVLVLISLVFYDVFSMTNWLYIFIVKMCIDFLLIFKTSRFLHQESVLISFIVSSLFYPIFSVYIVILSLFKPYKWKGRTFNK